MSANRYRRKRAVRLECRTCRIKVLLDETNLIFIISYQNQPWLDGFEWFCYGCRSSKRAFFDTGDVQLVDIWRFGAQERDAYADDEIALQYESTRIRYTAETDQPALERDLAKFIGTLDKVNDLASIHW